MQNWSLLLVELHCTSYYDSDSRFKMTLSTCFFQETSSTESIQAFIIPAAKLYSNYCLLYSSYRYVSTTEEFGSVKLGCYCTVITYRRFTDESTVSTYSTCCIHEESRKTRLCCSCWYGQGWYNNLNSIVQYATTNDKTMIKISMRACRVIDLN